MKNDINYSNVHESEILNAIKEHANAQETFKVIISDKEKALSLLKKLKDEQELFFAYQYAISDNLKSDIDIYNYIKSKLFFDSEIKVVDYTRSFIHCYGEAIGLTHDSQKIQQALEEMKKLPEYHAYWLFYSLYHATKISFETYKKIYTSFTEKTIQGFLLNHYCENENAIKSEVMELIKISSPECLKENWFFVTSKFHDKEIFDILVKNGIDANKLIQNFERNIKIKKIFNK